MISGGEDSDDDIDDVDDMDSSNSASKETMWAPDKWPSDNKSWRTRDLEKPNLGFRLLTSVGKESNDDIQKCSSGLSGRIKGARWMNERPIVRPAPGPPSSFLPSTILLVLSLSLSPIPPQRWISHNEQNYQRAQKIEKRKILDYSVASGDDDDGMQMKNVPLNDPTQYLMC
jgi:hypothetical protein